MDKEQREALELTREELVTMLEAGQPADLARVPPVRVSKPGKRRSDVTRTRRTKP